MDTTTRRGVYLRDRSELTPAQRRRLRKGLNREVHAPVVRASRLRKSVERNARRQLRGQAQGLMWVIRTGQLRKGAQRERQSQGTIARLRAALDSQKSADTSTEA